MSDDDFPPERDPRVLEAALVAEIPFLVRVLMRMRIPAEDVGDVAQEVLIAAWQNPSFDPACGDVRGWLYGIARRKARDYRQSVGRRRRWGDLVAEPPQDIADPADPPDAGVGRNEISRLLEELLDKLDPDLRDLIVAHELDGLSLSETAQAFGLSENSVRGRLYRARQALKAAAAAYQKKHKLRGMVGLPFGLATMFAAHRAYSQELAQEVFAALVPELAGVLENARQCRTAEETATSAWDRALDGANPGASRFGSMSARLAHHAGPFVGGTLFGGILVAALLWPVTPEESPKAEETSLVAVALVDTPPTWQPTDTAAPQVLAMPAADTLANRTKKPPPRQPKRVSAHDLLQTAELALDDGDAGKAREALDRYDREFPDSPLSATRHRIEARLSGVR